MSPKKKPAPTAKSATKDDLINSLFESESAGPNSSRRLQPDSARGSSPPPPPAVKSDNDRIYNFGDEADFNSSNDKTLSIVRNSSTTGDEVSLRLEEPKTIVQSAHNDDTQPGPEQSRRNKLEDVLRKIKPLYNSETAVAAVEKAKAENPNALEAMAPPPVTPVGVVARAERAPTEPVGSVKPTVDPNVDEKTVPQQSMAKTELMPRPSLDSPEADPEGEQFMPTEIRPNSPGARFREEARQAQPGAAIFSSAEAALRQSENLRVAQKRISDLENELERVRRENESVRSAGETLRRRMDELQAHAETAELNAQETKRIAEEERKVLKGQIQSRDRELAEMKSRIDDAETRLEANFRKIRVRERDLEHRIEIIKAESQSITASKDRMILELKRQIDQITSELNHSKAQVQETFGQFKEKQETARRAVRALRIALTVLEGEDDPGSRKAE